MDDKEVKAWHREILAKDLIKKMEKRGFKAFYAATAEEAKKTVLGLLPPKGAVGLLGSQTLNQIGVYGHLRESNRELVDHATQAKNLSEREAFLYTRKVFTAAAMLTGTNAVDSEGRLYNIDAIGNRVAPMIYGPEQVIVAVGLNKLVSTAEEAWPRIQQIAAPMNTKRLGIATPCAESGHCHNCQLPIGICNYFTVIDRSRPEGRIKVVLIGEDLGY